MKKKSKLKKIKFIPVNIPKIFQQDKINVKKSLDSGWISSEGSNVKKFEKTFSKFIGHKYGVAVSSGTAALEVAIKTLNLKKNDEIIIPNFTIISNALPAIKFGITPIIDNVKFLKSII